MQRPPPTLRPHRFGRPMGWALLLALGAVLTHVASSPARAEEPDREGERDASADAPAGRLQALQNALETVRRQAAAAHARGETDLVQRYTRLEHAYLILISGLRDEAPPIRVEVRDLGPGADADAERLRAATPPAPEAHREQPSVRIARGDAHLIERDPPTDRRPEPPRLRGAGGSDAAPGLAARVQRLERENRQLAARIERLERALGGRDRAPEPAPEGRRARREILRRLDRIEQLLRHALLGGGRADGAPPAPRPAARPPTPVPAPPLPVRRPAPAREREDG